MELYKKLLEKLMESKCKNMEPLKLKAYLYRRGIKDNLDD